MTQQDIEIIDAMLDPIRSGVRAKVALIKAVVRVTDDSNKRIKKCLSVVQVMIIPLDCI